MCRVTPPKARSSSSSSSEARLCLQRRTPLTPATEIRTKLAHFCIFQYRSYCLAEWDVLLSLFNIAVRTKRKLCVPECSVLSAIVIYSSVLSPVLSHTIHLLEFLLWQYLVNSPMPFSLKKFLFRLSYGDHFNLSISAIHPSPKNTPWFTLELSRVL